MALVINYDKKAFCGLRLFLYPISLTFRDCNFTGKNARRGDRKHFFNFLICKHIYNTNLIYINKSIFNKGL